MIEAKTKLIGILGGMGPEATAAFFYKIIKNTPAEKDQDHLRILIYNNPKIPDRTSAILGNGESPLHALQASARFLADTGVDLIAIPCVTSHVYYEEIQKSVSVPIVNIIDETIAHIKTRVPDKKQIGLMATSGAVKSGLFQRACDKRGLQIVTPKPEEQEMLMDAIYGGHGIKAKGVSDTSKKQMLIVANSLIRRGAELVIGGCTEIPLAITQADVSVEFVDTLELLARATIDRACAQTYAVSGF